MSTPQAWQLRALCVVLLVFAASTARHPLEWRITMALGALLALTPWLIERRAVWWFLAASVGAAILFSPLSAANHHHLLLYMTAAIALTWSEDREHWAVDIGRASRGLMVGVMGVATLQKLLSPDFMDGSFLTFLLLDGGLGEVFWEHIPALQGAISDAHKFFLWFADPIDPRRATARAVPARLMPAGTFAVALAWLVVLGEGVIAALFALGAKFDRAELAAHVALLLFGAGLLFVRAEHVFLTTLLWLGAAVCLGRETPKLITRAYLVLGSVAACVALARVIL